MTPKQPLYNQQELLDKVHSLRKASLTTFADAGMLLEVLLYLDNVSPELRSSVGRTLDALQLVVGHVADAYDACLRGTHGSN